MNYKKVKGLKRLEVILIFFLQNLLDIPRTLTTLMITIITITITITTVTKTITTTQFIKTATTEKTFTTKSNYKYNNKNKKIYKSNL